LLCKKFFLFRSESAEDVIGYLLFGRWSIDADSQSPEILASEFAYHAFESIVTCRASAEFELYLADGKIDFVMDHEDVLG